MKKILLLICLLSTVKLTSMDPTSATRNEHPYLFAIAEGVTLVPQNTAAGFGQALGQTLFGLAANGTFKTLELSERALQDLYHISCNTRQLHKKKLKLEKKQNELKALINELQPSLSQLRSEKAFISRTHNKAERQRADKMQEEIVEADKELAEKKEKLKSVSDNLRKTNKKIKHNTSNSLVNWAYNRAKQLVGLSKPVQSCAYCTKKDKKGEKLSKCINCGSLEYCSKECSEFHWKKHQADCTQLVLEKLKQEKENKAISNTENEKTNPETPCSSTLCNKEAKGQCINCGTVAYCSNQCAALDWARHKDECLQCVTKHTQETTTNSGLEKLNQLNSN